MSPAYRVFPKVFGNTMNSHKLFMDRLKSKANLHEVHSENDCDVLIAFVPIVSRAGTDIQAALEKIPEHSYKRIILVVLHHTFDPHYIAPDSRYSVRRNDVFAVDCLYYEDQGLLKSKYNDEALESVIMYLGAKKPQGQDADLWSNDVKNTELTCWILAVIIIFPVYFVLPEDYSFFTFLSFEIFLLIIILVALTHYYSHRRIWAVCIFILINFLLFFIFLTQTPVTEQQD